MPTKPEQADLLNVMFGRNSESPVPVIAAATPSDCFDAAVEAARIAIKYRTPVFLLSDAYLANGSEPWLLPNVDEIATIDPQFAEPNGDYQPYLRDEETLARPWAIPGTPGLEHRIGGLEKQDVTGNVSYDPENHDRMVRLRAQKVAGIAQDIPELEVDDPDGAETLVLSWGGTYGSVAAGVRRVRARRKKVAHAHLRYLNPFPRNTGEVVRRYEKILVPEINLGQLVKLIRAEFLVDATGFNLVRGIPFRASEVEDAIDADERNLAGDAAHMCAIAVDDRELQEQWTQRGLDEGDPYWAGPLYNNLGVAYSEAGDHARALELFELALEARLRDPDNEQA